MYYQKSQSIKFKAVSLDIITLELRSKTLFYMVEVIYCLLLLNGYKTPQFDQIPSY